MIRVLVLALLALPACKKSDGPAGSADARDPSAAADALFDRFLEATGGVEASRAVQNQVAEAVVTLPAQGLTLSMTLWTERPDRSRIDFQVPMLGKVSSGYADGIAWELNPMLGPRILDGREAEEAARRNRMDLFEDYRIHYPKRVVVGKLEFGGVPCTQVEVETSTGLPTSMFFADETGLWMGMSGVGLVQGGEVEATTVVEQYAQLGGTLYPVLSRQQAGPIETVTRFTKVESNIEGFPDLTPPPEILELLEGGE
ncbi:MAG: hypothetical protein H6737_11425 [Alphaproteobacteria bacterium]|nr:hypothetical protein [Alphaproteobacteria bacterium]